MKGTEEGEESGESAAESYIFWRTLLSKWGFVYIGLFNGLLWGGGGGKRTERVGNVSIKRGGKLI